MNQTEFKEMLENLSYLKEDLFIRGFLITDKKQENLDEFPFYGNWKTEQYGNFYFLAHKLTGMHVFSDAKGNYFFIMGHAYNPFTMEYREEEILKHLSSECEKGKYLDAVNELTGIFVTGVVSNDRIAYVVDAAGIQSACSGVIDGSFYLTSHAQLVGDICGLHMDSFVKELTQYKWYHRLLGPYLPADLTPFSELKRVVSGQLYTYKGTITRKRFWPLKPINMAYDEESYNEVIQKGAEILHNNMLLVTKKWNRPWISLTGGIDSNTTFAAANGLYDQIETFSYISAEKEIPDAAAAKKVSEHFNVKHHEYQIPEDSSEIKDFEEIRELFRHNNGYIAELYDNEARKKIYLREHIGCDVEVKSWVSETIRAYWYKYFGRKSFPKLSGKEFRNFYKIFTFNRILAHKIDKLFEKYIDEYEYKKIPDCYPPADMNYHEVGWGSWGSENISEMKYYTDITLLYDNRRFLEMMFRVPLEKRISDQHHMDMKKILNKELYDMHIRVKNLKETDFRAFMLNVIFTINSILPF